MGIVTFGIRCNLAIPLNHFIQQSQKLLFIALTLGKRLHHAIDEPPKVIPLHIQLLLQALIFFPELIQTVFGLLDRLSEVIGFPSDMDKVVLEAVISGVQLHDLFF